MIIFKNGVVGHYKRIFSNVSFPLAGPTEDFLIENEAKIVKVKSYNLKTQKLVPCDPFEEDNFVYTSRVEDKTQEELSEEIRLERNKLLKESDWTQGKDIPNSISEPWAVYRQSLRDLPNDTLWPNVQLPHDPNYVEPE